MTNREDQYQRIAAGIAGRLRGLALTLDRLDRLEAGTETWLADFEKEELDLAASEMTLRALQAATEPPNYKILQALASQPALSTKELTAAANQERLVLSERLNDLIQVGLSARLIDTDQVQITAAGAALVLLIQEIAEQVAKEYRSRKD